jgi:hypothetical protein
MTALAAVCSALTAAASVALLRRLWAAARDGQERLRAARAPDDLPSRLLRLVRAGLDAGLLADAGPGGLADVAVRLREPHDPYRNAGELLDWLAGRSGAADYDGVCGLIKGVYQLGHALRSPDPAVRGCLETLLARVRVCRLGETPVGRVECVTAGAMLDPRTMVSLNYGARVAQPLGVVVYDAGGRVLGKAKVLCG